MKGFELRVFGRQASSGDNSSLASTGAARPRAALDYRPEIDGLRALAVLSVMFFHFDIQGFSGGFVGVDVFFVISGFLITRLIRTRLDQGKFTYTDFYARRARRILPALFATLFGSLLVGALLLPPALLNQLFKSTIYAALGLSNFHFWLESGYFAADAINVPLLHTWTLGVEEQFYVIWPAVLLLLAALRQRWMLIAGLAVIAGTSLVAAEYVLNQDATAAFFLMPFRMAEFIAGAVLVWVGERSFASNAAREISCVAGLALIAAAVVFYYPEMRFPALSAMLPCIGASLVILSGSPYFSGYLLRNPVSVWIGRISYSLYLVHWPLLCFFYQWTLEPPSSAAKVGLSIGSLLLASLMFRFVEQPFRYGWPSAPRARVFGVAGTTLAALVIVCGAGLLYERFFTTSMFDAASVKALKEKRFVTRQEICIRKGWDHCDDIVRGATNVLVIGDSQAIDGYNAIHEAAPEANLVLSTLGGCPPYDKMDGLLPINHPNRAECIKLNEERFSKDFLSSFDMIAVNALFGWYTPEHLERFLDYVRSVSPSTSVLVFGNYTILNTECWEIAARLGLEACGDKKFIESQFQYDDALAEVSRRYGASFVSMRSIFCPDVQCILLLNAVPFTWDKFHLSYEFSLELGRRMKALGHLKPLPQQEDSREEATKSGSSAPEAAR